MDPDLKNTFDEWWDIVGGAAVVRMFDGITPARVRDIKTLLETTYAAGAEAGVGIDRDDQDPPKDW